MLDGRRQRLILCRCFAGAPLPRMEHVLQLFFQHARKSVRSLGLLAHGRLQGVQAQKLLARGLVEATQGTPQLVGAGRGRRRAQTPDLPATVRVLLLCALGLHGLVDLVHPHGLSEPAHDRRRRRHDCPEVRPDVAEEPPLVGRGTGRAPEGGGGEVETAGGGPPGAADGHHHGAGVPSGVGFLGDAGAAADDHVEVAHSRKGITLLILVRAHVQVGARLEVAVSVHRHDVPQQRPRDAALGEEPLDPRLAARQEGSAAAQGARELDGEGADEVVRVRAWHLRPAEDADAHGTPLLDGPVGTVCGRTAGAGAGSPGAWARCHARRAVSAAKRRIGSAGEARRGE
mmetsp:Transcript_144251/g.461975  ORF Transcript_144251/g.461975 Transcript_144251/m.461975 type:complete len:344 (-) Transcript_144251:57-1088(-)